MADDDEEIINNNNNNNSIMMMDVLPTHIIIRNIMRRV